MALSMGGFVGEATGSGTSGEPRVWITEVYTNVNVNNTPPDPSYNSDNIPTGGVVGLAQGAIGSYSGAFASGTRCAVFYNKTVDGGAALPTDDIFCNAGMTTSELQSAHPSPNKVLYPYTIGTVITQQMINDEDIDQCKLASGSDGDWGFGSCSGDPVLWKTNANNQYTTLVNIPNPGVQILQ